MSYYAIDTRDWVGQQVTADYSSDDPRFIKVSADSMRQAFYVARDGLAAAGEFKRAQS